MVLENADATKSTERHANIGTENSRSAVIVDLYVSSVRESGSNQTMTKKSKTNTEANSTYYDDRKTDTTTKSMFEGYSPKENRQSSHISRAHCERILIAVKPRTITQ